MPSTAIDDRPLRVTRAAAAAARLTAAIAPVASNVDLVDMVASHLQLFDRSRMAGTCHVWHQVLRGELAALHANLGALRSAIAEGSRSRLPGSPRPPAEDHEYGARPFGIDRVNTRLSCTGLAVPAGLDDAFFARLLFEIRTEHDATREDVMILLHRTYRAFTAKRTALREMMRHILSQTVHANVPHPGMRELLELLHSIIDGFATPLRNEHETFLFEALLPLYTWRCAPSDGEEPHQRLPTLLWQCVRTLIEKKPDLKPRVKGYLEAHAHWDDGVPWQFLRTQLPAM